MRVRDDSEVIDFLLKNDIDVDAQDVEGVTPLVVASEKIEQKS